MLLLTGDWLFTGELDSYMYQTAGHEMIEAVAKALDLPLHRRALQGTSLNVEENYAGPQAGDEVEDLYELLKEVKVRHLLRCLSILLSHYGAELDELREKFNL